MKIKVQDLAPLQLDWVVAVANESEDCRDPHVTITRDGEPYIRVTTFSGLETDWEPTTDWWQGGEIIEREKIDLVFHHVNNTVTAIKWFEGQNKQTDESPLVAAVRVFVASKFGEFVEVPDELLNR